KKLSLPPVSDERGVLVGNKKAMKICRNIGLELSDVIVANALDYNVATVFNPRYQLKETDDPQNLPKEAFKQVKRTPYRDVTTDQLYELFSKSSSIGTEAKTKYPNRDGDTRYWIVLGAEMYGPKSWYNRDGSKQSGWIRYGKCFQFAGLMSLMLV